MKDKKVFTVTDLGGGDGGKGGVVHKLCVLKNAHTVLKVGGAQGSHGVRTSRGQRFNFSQFGCGTFEGVRTHITNQMVVEPIRLLAEAEELKHEWGIGNIFSYLTVDENALCITPYHTIASRLNELARKNNPKGTIGIGAGEAVLDSERYPEMVIHVQDLNSPMLRSKLEMVRFVKLIDLKRVVDSLGEILPQDFEKAKEELALLHNPQYLDWAVEQFKLVASQIKVVGTDYLKREILSRDGTVVVESSHGILTDRYNGFHPHTSRLRTVPQGTLRLLEECGYDGQVVKLGVTRAYQIRHGAGPMVTESAEFIDQLLPDSSKDENRWQGKVRVGPLDLVALRYAIGVCGGPEFFDGLAITWFDQIQKLGKWPVCDSYRGIDDHEFFSPTGEILIRRGDDRVQLDHQQALGQRLRECRPNLTWHDLPIGEGNEGDIKVCAGVLGDKLKVPVRMISFGQTENDKVCI